jgi:hypothetical protein
VRRLLLAFVFGAMFGSAVTLRDRQPCPQPTTPILAAVDEAGLSRAQCDAHTLAAVLHERVRLTGAINPPAKELP